VLVAAAALVVVGVAFGVTGAINTTDDPLWAGPADSGTLLGGPTQPCLNGQPGHLDPATNCNIYTNKTDVFLSGSPDSAALGDGTYFFAVLSPGGQPAPNDGGTNKVHGQLANLSDNADAWTNREFSVSGGTITMLNNSTHAYDATKNLVQVAPYADTPNPGGVYILAVCQVPDPVTDSPGVDPRDCKYDAFKVVGGTVTPPAADLEVEKNASASYTRTFSWDSAKSVDNTLVKQIGGSATFTYTATYTPTVPGIDSAWSVTGTITVTNPNTTDVTGVNISDQLNNTGTICSVDDGTYTDGDGNTQTVSASSGTIPSLTAVSYDYSCSPGGTSDTLNTATATWDKTTNGTPTGTASGDAGVTWGDPTLANDCVNATDSLDLASPATTLATLCVDKDGNLLTPSNVNNSYGSAPGVTASIVPAVVSPPAPAYFKLVYKQTFTVPTNDCVTHTNTADFVTDTSSSSDGTLSDNTVTVTVCGPGNGGGLTIGFWKGPNGQGLINNYCGGTNTLANYLSNFIPTGVWTGSGSGPFAGAYGKACGSTLTTYINGIISGATATNMNVMLKAQMLGTALDVYFSTTGYGYSSTNKTVGGKTVKAPSNFLSFANSHGGAGAFNMDLTAICPMVDNSTGTATCSGGKPSTNGITSGAFNASPKLISVLLTYEANAPQWALSGTPAVDVWYAGSRTKEEVAKNAFDQFNNNLAFGSY
jgi:hypothetical protein